MTLNTDDAQMGLRHSLRTCVLHNTGGLNTSSGMKKSTFLARRSILETTLATLPRGIEAPLLYNALAPTASLRGRPAKAMIALPVLSHSQSPLGAIS